MRRARPLLPALLAGTALVSVPALAHAQTAGPGTPATSATPATSLAAALPTGFFFRTGVVASSFNLEQAEFRQRDWRGAGPVPDIPGKQLGFRTGLLPGVTLGLNVDARWAYVRVAADLYQPPDSDRSDENSAQITTLVWSGVGGRLPLGAFALTAGVRLGALLVNATYRSAATGMVTQYSSVSGLYAGDLGVQWRPLPWFEIDATIGQDISRLGATTVGLAASLGWSRSRTPR